MSAGEANKALVADYLREVDSGNVEALRDFCGPKFVLHLPGFPPLGLEAAIESGLNFRAAFPDLGHETLDLIAEGDQVVLSTVIKGTQTGSFQGIEASGRLVAVSVVTIFRLEDGKISEIWELADLLHFFLQLGFSMQPPATGKGNGF